MGDIGSDYKNVGLDSMLGDNHSDLMPSTVYVTVSTTDPAGEDGLTEPGGNFERAAVPNDTTNWPDATDGQKQNGQAITWDTPDTAWGVVRFWAIMDDEEDGVIIAYGKFSTHNPYVEAGALTPRIPANTLAIIHGTSTQV